MGALFLAQEKDESRLLYDMGRETANIHFGSPKAIAHVKRDLTPRRSRWLHRAAKGHVQATLKDWDNWQQS